MAHATGARRSPRRHVDPGPSRRPDTDSDSSPTLTNAYLELQQGAGNRAVLAMTHPPVHRAPPEAPPKRPTPVGKRADEASPKDYYQVRSAILAFAPGTIRPEDLATLSNEQLRSLDFACEHAIEVARRFAADQASDPGWTPPEGYPDLVYRNARADLERFQADSIHARRPHASLLAAQNYFAEEGGDTPMASGHWAAAMPKVKEMVWRMELGTAERTPASLTSLLSDDEVRAQAYLTEAVWRQARRDPLEAGEGIDPGAVLGIVKSEGTVVAVRLALAAVMAAGRVTKEDRHDPSDAARDRVYNVIQAGMEAELAAIDRDTQKALTFINSQRVTGGFFDEGTTHENSFWKFLWSSPGGRDWVVLQRYRTWADE